MGFSRLALMVMLARDSALSILWLNRQMYIPDIDEDLGPT